MPILQIFTNLSRSKIPLELPKKCAKLLAVTLRNKPLDKMCISISPEQIMWTGSMASDTQPTIFARLNCVGAVTPDDNRKTITAITKLLEDELKVSSSEIRIVFHDIGSTDLVGFGGKLLADQ